MTGRGKGKFYMDGEFPKSTLEAPVYGFCMVGAKKTTSFHCSKCGEMCTFGLVDGIESIMCTASCYNPECRQEYILKAYAQVSRNEYNFPIMDVPFPPEQIGYPTFLEFGKPIGQVTTEEPAPEYDNETQASEETVLPGESYDNPIELD